MPSEVPSPALLDTSAVIDLPELIELGVLPEHMAVCTITLAELAVGPSATTDPKEAARRQNRLQMVEATFEPIPFSAAAARAYGLVYTATAAREIEYQPHADPACDLFAVHYELA